MSTYCTIGGEISYQNKKDFDAALSVLRVGGWLKENNFIDDFYGFRLSSCFFLINFFVLALFNQICIF